MSESAKGANSDNKQNGAVLRENNEKIVRLMMLLKQQRGEMNFLIQKQQEEKNKIQTEIERLTFKLSLLTKSLNQRIQAKANYDKTIRDIDENYLSLVEESGKLLCCLTKEVQELEEIMDKKTSTASAQVKTIRPTSKDYTNTTPEPTTTSEPDDNSYTDDEQQLLLQQQLQQQLLQQQQQQKSEQSSRKSSASQNEVRTSLNSPRKSSDDRPPSQRSSQDRKRSSGESDRSSFDEKLKDIRGSLERTTEKKRSTLDKKKTSLENIMESDSERKRSLEISSPYRDIIDNASKNDIPPPIVSSKVKNEDIEIQSYREAYGRQHNAPSPPHSIDGNHTPPRKLSASIPKARKASE